MSEVEELQRLIATGPPSQRVRSDKAAESPLSHRTRSKKKKMPPPFKTLPPMYEDAHADASSSSPTQGPVIDLNKGSVSGSLGPADASLWLPDDSQALQRFAIPGAGEMLTISIEGVCTLFFRQGDPQVLCVMDRSGEGDGSAAVDSTSPRGAAPAAAQFDAADGLADARASDDGVSGEAADPTSKSTEEQLLKLAAASHRGRKPTHRGGRAEPSQRGGPASAQSHRGPPKAATRRVFGKERERRLSVTADLEALLQPSSALLALSKQKLTEAAELASEAGAGLAASLERQLGHASARPIHQACECPPRTAAICLALRERHTRAPCENTMRERHATLPPPSAAARLTLTRPCGRRVRVFALSLCACECSPTARLDGERCGARVGPERRRPHLQVGVPVGSAQQPGAQGGQPGD